MTPRAYRLHLGRRLQLARGERSVHSCDESGVGYRVIRRLEAGGNTSVRLDKLYTLAGYYAVGLGSLLSPRTPDLGTWLPDAPPWPVVDVAVRTQLRQVRTDPDKYWGTLRLSAAAGHPQVVPSWIFRTESGEVDHLDVVRLHAVMTVLGGTVADLLPAQMRMREDVERTKHRTRAHGGTALGG